MTKAKAAATAANQSVKSTLIQIAIVVACLLVGGLMTTGHIGQYIPKPVVGQPVKITMHGPTEVIVGKEFIFYIEIEGTHGTPKWELIPDTPGAMTVSADGMKAHFNFDQPGFFSLTASVAGEGLSVDSKHIEFDSLPASDDSGSHPQPQPAPQPQPLPPVGPQPCPPQPAPQPVPQPPMPQPSDDGKVTVSSLVIAALGNHQTDDAAKSVVEAQKIGACVNTLITKISSGLVDTKEDPIEALVPIIQQTLGDRADSWAVFVTELSGIFDELRQQGAVTDIASYQPYLKEVALTLLRVKKEVFTSLSTSFERNAAHAKHSLVPVGHRFGPRKS